MKREIRRPLCAVLCSFLICLIARFFEYFVLKTDESILAENVWHKLFGIAVLIGFMVWCGYRSKDIGAGIKGSIRYILGGLGLGVAVYIIAYGNEFLICYGKGEHPVFKLYAESFSIAGETVISTSASLIFLCLLMNIINVIMEEGTFRGFYDKVLSISWSFWKRTILIACLFGFWHVTMTIRSFVYGEMNLGQTLFMTTGYIMLAGMMSVKWALLKKLYGTIWIGAAEHFFSNSITNLVHIVGNGEADQLQIVRVMLANMISFCVVLIWYCVRNKTIGQRAYEKKKEKERTERMM